MGTSIFLLGLNFGPRKKCSQSKGLQASLGWSQQSNSCTSLNSSPHPAVQAVPPSPVPGGEECPAFLPRCQPHWHFLSHSQQQVRRRHHKVLFRAGSAGGTEGPLWPERPADVPDTFFTPLYATRQALVIICCHRNLFLHAADCESFRTAARHCPGREKTMCRGRGQEAKRALSCISSSQERDRQKCSNDCRFSGN